MKRLFICFFISFSTCVFMQNKVAEYKSIYPDFFSIYEEPIEVAIFPFIYNNEESEITSKFYEKLSSALGKGSDFIVNYYKKLDALKEAWGIKRWDPSNMKTLDKLKEELDIKIIVFAVLQDPKGSSLTLKIISTRDRKELYSKEYVDTKNSNAIEDIVKLFTDRLSVDYKDIPKAGTLIINTIPTGEFQVHLNGQLVGLTPYENSNLKKGDYLIEIKDVRNEYSDYKEIFKYDPEVQQKWNKNIVLQKVKRNIVEEVKPTAVIESKVSTSTNKEGKKEATSNSLNAEKLKGYTTLTFIGTFPQKDFSSKSGKTAGFAENGYGGSLDFDVPLIKNISWIIGLAVSQNELKTNSKSEEEKRNYIVGMISTGSRLRILFFTESDFYVIGQVGLLVSKYPDRSYTNDSYYNYYKSELKSDLALGFVYGGGFGFRTGVLDIGVRYFVSKPEYKFKSYHEDSSGSYSSEVKVKLPYTALFLVAGLRF